MNVVLRRSMRRGIIPGIIKRSTVAQGATPPVDLLRAAITHTSIAIAVCDHDFTMRFFNPAIGRLIDRASTLAGDTPAVLHGAAVLGLLGVDDVAAAMADIAAHGTWRGVARAQHVAVEPFGDAGSTAGWSCAGAISCLRMTPRSCRL